MFKSSKIYLLTAVMVIVTAIIFAGCSQSQKPLPSQPSTPSPGTTETTPGNNSGTGGQSLSTIQAPSTESGMDMAKKITQRMTAIAGIKRTAVLIDGKTAIVGVNFTDGTGKVATTALKGATTPSPMPGTNSTMAPGNVGITAGRETGLPGTQTQVNPTNPASPNSAIQYNTMIKGQTGTVQNQVSNDLKTLIANRVKAIDPNISKVLVTTDIVMVDKMQRLSDVLNKDMRDIKNKIQAGGGVR